ncbi:hypothetical protein J7337_005141 [Fusarium musae]|uniref:Uncharacterized protein n=1 Tax=Fusarium musae TaxID=1042133 RepID=A0A9P8DHW6_9HYPO|nr:hypothetical protein J7337_005141 [Fusarium musae]KAG9502314.1 hypothetical protein J7337_005141 [Fusarium musae]
MSETCSARPKRKAALRANKMITEPELLWKAFEKAKPRMCGQAAKKTIEVMEDFRLLSDYESPRKHSFYAKVKGKGQEDDPEFYYYPYLLVLQALWPDSEHVQTLAKAFARYWGVPEMWRGPEYYPMLNDRDREMELFTGKKPRETKAREDQSSSGSEEEEKHVKQEEAEEQEQEEEQEDEQEDEQAEDQEQEQQLDGEQNEDNEEQAEQQNEEDEVTIPDMDAITDIDELDELENKFEKREKELIALVHEAKEVIRKVQERKRDHFKKKSRASKKARERLLKKLEEENKISDHWEAKEREYTEKLQRSSATSSAISPPPEQEAERPAKRRRVVEPEE